MNQNINIEHTVCFTGHRPKTIFKDSPYDRSKRPMYQKIVDELHIVVCDLIQKGYTHFITGGAQGFDQLAFWAVNSAKSGCKDIVNDVYIPFKGQSNKWAETGLFSKKEYEQMLNLADNIYVCTETIDINNYKDAVKALMYRNECMVNASSLVVGQYINDTWKTASRSGTANCLQYADTKHKTLIVRPFGCEM